MTNLYASSCHFSEVGPSGKQQNNVPTQQVFPDFPNQPVWNGRDPTAVYSGRLKSEAIFCLLQFEMRLAKRNYTLSLPAKFHAHLDTVLVAWEITLRSERESPLRGGEGGVRADVTLLFSILLRTKLRPIQYQWA